jgi:hypothetical protein
LVCKAVTVVSARTTPPDITSCRLIAPSSKTGQSMNGKLLSGQQRLVGGEAQPELLRSIVRPEPFSTGTPPLETT